ncbi:hypothetical protein DY000_02006395 [Brassica cretica]|uniref:Uncharacterized protein n=1 Tax=Brassica cretica TaxID=69181 RepID=A0ABQ7CHK6_BRACR|nr:hypothetical protein DY000_02006395 [Brassica cretica]
MRMASVLVSPRKRAAARVGTRHGDSSKPPESRGPSIPEPGMGAAVILMFLSVFIMIWNKIGFSSLRSPLALYVLVLYCREILLNLDWKCGIAWWSITDYKNGNMDVFGVLWGVIYGNKGCWITQLAGTLDFSAVVVVAKKNKAPEDERCM